MSNLNANLVTILQKYNYFSTHLTLGHFFQRIVPPDKVLYDLSTNEALYGKRQQYCDGEEEAGPIHQVVEPTVIVQ